MTRVSRDRNNQEPKERAAQQLVWWPSSLARTHKLPHRMRLRPQRLSQQPPRFHLLCRTALRARRVRPRKDRRDVDLISDVLPFGGL